MEWIQPHLRFSIAILYIFIAIFLTDKSLLKINKEDIPLFVLCGLCILGLNLCYNSSINTVPLSLAAILLSTAPVFVLVLEYLLFKEKITSIKVLCVILVLIGCTLVTGLLEENSIDISWIGIIAGIGSAIFWAIYSVTSRKSIDMGRHTFTILLYSLITITIVTIPFTNFTQIANFVNLSPVQNILFLLLHSLVSFALPYVFITISLNHLDAGTAVILSSGEPIAALAFGYKIRKYYSALILQHKNPTANNNRIINKTKEKPPKFLDHTNLKKLNIKQD